MCPLVYFVYLGLFLGPFLGLSGGAGLPAFCCLSKPSGFSYVVSSGLLRLW